MKRLFTILLLVLLGWTMTGTLAQQKAANEQNVQVQPSKDVTLVENAKGLKGNSKGDTLFVGLTGQNAGPARRRRSLIAFDLTTIPPRSRVLSVTLNMHVKIAAGALDAPTSAIGLYRVTRSWKEGTSAAQGAVGADAQAGDPTWIHNVFSTSRWSRPGGDYVKAASAKTDVKGPGDATWNSTPKLVADVQSWVNSPKTNFGWIIIGDEAMPDPKTPPPANAKGFHSSEATDDVTRPKLTVVFRPR